MELYANSSKLRPSELDGGGRGLYCCIPLCGSASYDRLMNKSNIGFFKFPIERKNSEQRKKWVSTIKQFRRKGSGDTFEVNSSTRVCEFHFKPEEIKVSAGIGRKTLLPGVFPTMFKFREKHVRKKRKSPAKRREIIEESTESEYEEEDDNSEIDTVPLKKEGMDHIVDTYYDADYCCRDKDIEIERLK